MAEFVERENLTLDVHNMARLCRMHGFLEYDQLLMAIGRGTVKLSEAERNAIKGGSSSSNIFERLFGTSKKEEPLPQLPQASTLVDVQKIDKKRPLILTDEALQSSYRMADCCHPIPGDDVLGFIDEDGQIVIHQRKCPKAAKLKAAYGNRLVAAQWSTHKLLYFSVSLNIKGIDGVGVVNQITNVISQELNVNMERILIEAHDGIFDGTIRLRVHDVDDIKTISENLKKLNNVRSVVRIDE